MATMDNDVPNDVNRERLTVRSEQAVVPKTIKKLKIRLRRLVDQGSFLPDKILLASRVIIIEGIPGSGKDMFQAQLKEMIKGRDVYDYSEGELLHSWKHVPIDGILKLRVDFMKLFVNCVRDIVSRDDKPVFLLNRFHLSAYVTTIIKQPELGRDYDEIIKVLRTLPVHVFILRLDEKEIKERSLHSERSSVWQKYQQQRAKKDGFADTFERYTWQQKLMLDAAERQQLPYSIMRLPRLSHFGRIHAPQAQSTSISGEARIKVGNAKVPLRKGKISLEV